MSEGHNVNDLDTITRCRRAWLQEANVVSQRAVEMLKMLDFDNMDQATRDVISSGQPWYELLNINKYYKGQLNASRYIILRTQGFSENDAAFMLGVSGKQEIIQQLKS